jgi:hypothetical protein
LCARKARRFHKHLNLNLVCDKYAGRMMRFKHFTSKLRLYELHLFLGWVQPSHGVTRDLPNESTIDH